MPIDSMKFLDVREEIFRKDNFNLTKNSEQVIKVKSRSKLFYAHMQEQGHEIIHQYLTRQWEIQRMKRCTTALLKGFAQSKRVLFSMSPLFPKYNMCWDEILGPVIIIISIFSKRIPPIFPGCQWRDAGCHGQARIRKIMVTEGSLS